MARGKVPGGNWFDWCPMEQGVNPQTFYVVSAPLPDLIVSNISDIPDVHKQGESFNTNITLNRSEQRPLDYIFIGYRWMNF